MLFSSQFKTAFELLSESLFQFKNYFFTKLAVVPKDRNFLLLVPTVVMMISFGSNPLKIVFRVVKFKEA